MKIFIINKQFQSRLNNFRESQGLFQIHIKFNFKNLYIFTFARSFVDVFGFFFNVAIESVLPIFIKPSIA
ncbi:hypothetical protein BpHYR1_045526 [Brachionus plicatilis]|uniref:Uncharacterized protein n=1 Tax=Brachionus plicatilis TaxID=10195 RepID=A0A3M7SFZ5_BRAPC|nr:hypothetical protein BpHYR1_045526 [Brachionus plicatilis]